MTTTTKLENDGARSNTGSDLTLSLQPSASAMMLLARWVSIRAAGGIMISWAREAFSPLSISIFTIRRTALFGGGEVKARGTRAWCRMRVRDGLAVMHLP